jgi:hypothetical protein
MKIMNNIRQQNNDKGTTGSTGTSTTKNNPVGTSTTKKLT